MRCISHGHFAGSNICVINVFHLWHTIIGILLRVPIYTEKLPVLRWLIIKLLCITIVKSVIFSFRSTSPSLIDLHCPIWEFWIFSHKAAFPFIHYILNLTCGRLLVTAQMSSDQYTSYFLHTSVDISFTLPTVLSFLFKLLFWKYLFFEP